MPRKTRQLAYHPLPRPYNRLTAAMRERGYSIAYVAEVLGLAPPTVYRLAKCGCYKSLRTPKALADLLGLSLEDLAPPPADPLDARES